MFGKFLMYYALFLAVNALAIILSVDSKNRKWQDIGYTVNSVAIIIFIVGVVAQLIGI